MKLKFVSLLFLILVGCSGAPESDQVAHIIVTAPTTTTITTLPPPPPTTVATAPPVVKKTPSKVTQVKPRASRSGSWGHDVNCESGGNPRAVSPSGKYRGKHQFSQETWEWVGGTGDPAQASEEEQDKRARELERRHRAGQIPDPWPNC